MPLRPHTGFNSAALVRQLAKLGVEPGGEARQSLAEHLGQWLDWTDAIELHRTLEAACASESPPASPPTRNGGAVRELAAALRQLREDLSRSIDAEPWPSSVAPAMPDASPPAALDWPACRQRLLAQQQAMGARIEPLRARLRASLANQSPAMARLAALDAVLDQAMAERAQGLLAKVPGLAARPIAKLPPAAGRQVLSQLLTAELELRLQPLQGLLDALGEHQTDKA